MEDDHAEYRDETFIEKLGIKDRLKNPLRDFWPLKGPQWDALGKAGNTVFLVEAKANIPEMVSSPSGAGIESLGQIKSSLDELKKYLSVNNDVDWAGKFYQYTNRLAHLYYLRELNKIDAYMMFIYFVNDSTVNGPTCKDKWEGAIEVMEDYLGLSKRHKLRKYVKDLFIDVPVLENTDLP
jgi:hypothetical protein